MSALRVATVNIQNDLSLWPRRRELLIEGLASLKLDLLALQEVRIQEQVAEWLAGRLGFSEVYITPKSDHRGQHEGIAILSRLPIVERDWLDLGSQSRVAQRVTVSHEGRAVVLANAHFYWWAGDSDERTAQVERLIAWLDPLMADSPVVVCGDFNATPDRPAIRRMYQDFESAHKAVHGAEPAYTCPTPLQNISFGRRLRQVIIDLVANKSLKSWRGAIDYVFINHKLTAKDCQVVLDQPAPDNPRLYPSDHFGIMAELELRNDEKS